MLRRGIGIGALVLAVTAARAAAQCPDGSPPPCRGARAAPAAPARQPAPNSVAVLYFDNVSRDTADQYLADGITEEIATSLGRITRLTIVSPAAVRRAQQAAEGDPARLARSLGVRHLVEGSVRRSGGQARITARLLGADARTTLWTDAYTRPTADLLALEEEIARQVASGVVGALLPEERRSLTAATVNPDAHDHVLRGNFELARRSEASIRRAIGEYEAAVASDSTYAQAWGRLALAQALLRYWSALGDRHTAPAESMQVRGERAAARALALDSGTVDAWLSLGYLRLYRDPVGMRGVLAAQRRAVALDPNSAEARHQLGAGLNWHADWPEAQVEYGRALALEPGRLVTYENLASAAFSLGQFADALRWTDSAIAVDPGHQYPYGIRAVAYAALGDSANALRTLPLAETPGAELGAPHVRCTVFWLLHESGVDAACRQALRVASSPVDSAQVYVSLGETDAALAALETAAGRRNEMFVWLRVNAPNFRPLRGNPRFERVLERLRPAEGSTR